MQGCLRYRNRWGDSEMLNFIANNYCDDDVTKPQELGKEY